MICVITSADGRIGRPEASCNPCETLDCSVRTSSPSCRENCFVGICTRSSKRRRSGGTVSPLQREWRSVLRLSSSHGERAVDGSKSIWRRLQRTIRPVTHHPSGTTRSVNDAAQICNATHEAELRSAKSGNPVVDIELALNHMAASENYVSACAVRPTASTLVRSCIGISLRTHAKTRRRLSSVPSAARGPGNDQCMRWGSPGKTGHAALARSQSLMATSTSWPRYAVRCVERAPAGPYALTAGPTIPPR